MKLTLFLKIKAMSLWILFEILLTSAVIYKQKKFALKRDCAISSKLERPGR